MTKVDPIKHANVILEAFIDESLKRSLAKGYRAPVFRDMRRTLGSVEACRRLAEAGLLQSGLRELTKLGLLDWSVEAIVMRFPDRFSRLTRESAKFKYDRAKQEAEGESK